MLTLRQRCAPDGALQVAMRGMVPQRTDPRQVRTVQSVVPTKPGQRKVRPEDNPEELTARTTKLGAQSDARPRSGHHPGPLPGRVWSLLHQDFASLMKLPLQELFPALEGQFRIGSEQQVPV
jgi:hypothetical protein